MMTTTRKFGFGAGWLLVGLMLGLMGVGIAADSCQPTESSTAEAAVWRDKAALLDPDAFVYYSDPPSFTVPEGETWYATNLWWVNVNGEGPVFHRTPTLDNAMPLPAGTTVTAASPTGFALVGQPSLVADDPRYTDDPRGLYYERVERLGTLERHTVKATVPAGSPRNTPANTPFPPDFERGMIVHVSSHDVAWTILSHSSGAGGINLDEEVSDDHPIRFTVAGQVPFVRSTLPGIRVRSASVDGFLTKSSLEGWGAVTYVKLPDDW